MKFNSLLKQNTDSSILNICLSKNLLFLKKSDIPEMNFQGKLRNFVYFSHQSVAFISDDDM